MSHELRTPLNSLLILSDQLSRNTESNLSPKQVEFSKTIHASGNDLLTLINDILDLSKIESGTVLVDPTDLLLEDLRRYVERTFRHVAEAKSVDFFIRLDPKLPKSMFADSKRLQQVLKNLLSNSFKFTHEGHVTLSIEPAKSGWHPDNEHLNRAPDVIAFSVTDTGIGISAEKQQIVFEAFQQADGSTNRKYGGTGLGLAISRELSRLLGGDIRLVSAPRVGSTFTLYLPQVYTAPRPRKSQPRAIGDAAPSGKAVPEAADMPPAPLRTERDEPRSPDVAPAPAALVNEVGDDRDAISLGDRTLLIVENDLAFARVVLDAAREHGFKGIVTSQGVAALSLAAQFKPSAVSLDLFLPDINGWRVLHRLKNDDATRHIPVAIISTDESRTKALDAGAYSFVAKPIQSKEVVDALLADLNRFAQRPEKSLLVASADPQLRDQLVAYLRADDLRISAVGDRGAAADAVAHDTVDCVVLDTRLPAGNGAWHAGDGDEPLRDTLPVILYGAVKGAEALDGWRGLARNIVLRDAQSLERLLDQASLFLHRDVARIPESQRSVLQRVHDSNLVLKDKRVMIVDDDMRNIFALTSLLEDQGMVVAAHDNGRDAIDHLQALPDVDVVLMDIMMPEIDGVDTIRQIRKIPACRDLPIIAVTAKAMKGDREKCMEAGAWDYLSKPVDTELMIGVLKAWLAR